MAGSAAQAVTVPAPYRDVNGWGTHVAEPDTRHDAAGSVDARPGFAVIPGQGDELESDVGTDAAPRVRGVRDAAASLSSTT
jgi:hypothetical protein